jgi:hypothetical protein
MPRQKPEASRYARRETGAGDVIIYDTENEQAWIQSDTTIDID